MSAVSIRALRKDFGTSRVIDGVDLEVGEGEFLVLLGPSGCGKTTTLRCVAGLERPDGGTVAIGQRLVADPAAAVFVPPHRRNIGMVFQNYALWPHMTVSGNVRYPLRARGVRGKAAAAAVDRALAVVGLSGTEGRRPPELSGGQQQRVALARALVAQPPLLLFDEPLSNLDAQLRLRLRQDLRRIHRETGHAAIYVTHDQAEALALADRVGVMRSGVLEQLGTPADVFSHPATAFVAEFVGFDNFLAGTVAERRDGLVSVTVPGWPGPLLARSGHPFPPGDPVRLAVRSSDVAVCAPGTPDSVPARLQDASYAGTSYLCSVLVGSYPLLGTMNQPSFEALASPSGAVAVSIAPSSVIALPVSQRSPTA